MILIRPELTLLQRRILTFEFPKGSFHTIIRRTLELGNKPMTTVNPSEPTLADHEVEEIIEDLFDEPGTHKDVIETVIGSLEQNDSAMVLHNKEGYLWKFQYGSVEVFVQLTGEGDDDLLTVWSPVLTLPATDKIGLLNRLLEMNWSDTFETRFAKVKDQIIVVSQRTVADLSPGEISRAVTLVATIADDHDESLKDTYGGT